MVASLNQFSLNVTQTFRFAIAFDKFIGQSNPFLLTPFGWGFFVKVLQLVEFLPVLSIKRIQMWNPHKTNTDKTDNNYTVTNQNTNFLINIEPNEINQPIFMFYGKKIFFLSSIRWNVAFPQNRFRTCILNTFISRSFEAIFIRNIVFVWIQCIYCLVLISHLNLLD